MPRIFLIGLTAIVAVVFLGVFLTTPNTEEPVQLESSSCFASAVVPVELCYDRETWLPYQPPGPGYEVYFTNPSGGAYFGLITEALPQSKDFMRKAILENAARAANDGAEGVETLSDKDISLNGQTWHYLEYTAILEGTKFRYGDYYVSVEGVGATQLLFFTADETFESYRQEINELVQGLTIKHEKKPL